MRTALGIYIWLGISLAAAQSAGRSDGSEKPRKGVKTPVVLTAKGGIKTPGIQIPIGALKAEAEIPGAPAWMAATDGLIVPSTDGKLVKIDAKTNKPGDAVADLGKACGGAVVAFTSLWAPDCASGKLARVDAKTWKATAQLSTGVGNVAFEIAATADSVWAFTDNRTTLSRIDPEANAVVSELRLDADCTNLTVADSSLWTLCPAEDTLVRINPLTNLVEKRITTSAQPKAYAFGETSLWVLCLKEGKVERIDPKTNKVIKTIDLETPGSTQGGLAIGAGSVWVTLDGFPLTQIDVTTEKVVKQFWGAGGGGIQFALNALWLSNLHEGTLWRIDPKRVTATLAE